MTLHGKSLSSWENVHVLTHVSLEIVSTHHSIFLHMYIWTILHKTIRGEHACIANRRLDLDEEIWNGGLRSWVEVCRGWVCWVIFCRFFSLCVVFVCFYLRLLGVVWSDFFGGKEREHLLFARFHCGWAGWRALEDPWWHLYLHLLLRLLVAAPPFRQTEHRLHTTKPLTYLIVALHCKL